MAEETNIQVKITQPGTTPIPTAKKICKEDIDINVNIAYTNEKITNISNHWAYKGMEFSSVNFPNLTSITGQLIFDNMLSLKTINLGENFETLGSCSLGHCGVETLIIRNPHKVCTLQNTTAFSQTPIADSDDKGYIFVPSSIYEQYVGNEDKGIPPATNWSSFAEKGKILIIPEGV